MYHSMATGRSCYTFVEMSLFWLLFPLLILLFYLAWQLLRLRRRLNHYTRLLRRAAEGDPSPLALPADFPGLEELSNATKALLTALHHQLATLDAERARLAAVLETMSDGVLIADAVGNVQFANPAAERLFDSPSPVARSLAEVLRHHQLIEAWRACQVSDEPQEVTFELPLRRQFLRMLVVPDPYGGGALLLIQDLTLLRRTETIRRDFISNLSHELRTPLASLKALIETLQDGALRDPEAGPRFLGRIQAEVEVLSRMAGQLLDLSRVESGQIGLEFAALAPRSLLDSVAERMRLHAERAGLSLRVECPLDLPTVRADRARLEQVLVNLIHNAVKFTPAGGEVALFAESTSGEVRFAVRDTGVGIPADDLPRVFERFYKSDRARSGGGAGLGLAIARHIIEAHGGKIWVESEEGRGSTFYFTVPHS